MTALTKLLDLNSKLPIELRAQQFLLINELHNEFKDEKSKLMDEYERIIRAMQDTKPYDVVAIAGTAEQLLNDVINVGDTVELRESNYNPLSEIRELDLSFNKVYLVDDTYIDTQGTSFVTVEGNSNEILAKRFRKVSTPLINPIQTIEGC